MAKSAKNISVKATPGKNTKVDPVLRLEDLLQKVQQVPARKAVRGRVVAAVGSGEAGARRLVAELAARLRALRAPASKPAAGSAKTRQPPLLPRRRSKRPLGG
jgi:hypothetical protein